MKKITAIIIDDEEMARNLLQGMLTEYCADTIVLDVCANLPSGVKAIRKHQPDLVFLDIEMPGHSGLELLDFFNEDEINFSIIFTTAYNQYAINAFKLAAIDYLLKPIEKEDLTRSVGRYAKSKDYKNYHLLRDNLNTGPKKIAIPTINAIKYISLSEILFLKAEGAYTEMFLADKTSLLASKGLKNFEDLLCQMPNFFRSHKSYIVNLKYVSEYVKSDGGHLLVNGMHRVSIALERAEELHSRINAIKINDK